MNVRKNIICEKVEQAHYESSNTRDDPVCYTRRHAKKYQKDIYGLIKYIDYHAHILCKYTVHLIAVCAQRTF